MANVTKTHNLAVKTGEYEVDGETKGRYMHVGALMEGKDGPFILLNAMFNPAGIAAINNDGRDTIIISCFEPREKEESGQQKNQRRGRERTQGNRKNDDL